MILNNKLYDALRWVVMILLPALSALYAGLAGYWGWPYVEQIVGSISVVDVFLGALMQISTRNYHKSTTE
jgi:TRAP-type C4-dicarboxylate transport system permease small subunit